MSESLRDQLKKAGFKDNRPAAKQRSGKPAAKSRSAAQAKKQQKVSKAQADEAASVAQKKELKKKIKTLIETHCIKDHTGTVAFSYQLGARVKQLFVNEQCQQQLAAGELLITRLNGSTFLIPSAIGEQISSLNPDWALITAGSQGSDDNIDETYADFQIPDDLNW